MLTFVIKLNSILFKVLAHGFYPEKAPHASEVTDEILMPTLV